MALEIFKLMGTVAIDKDKALQDIKAVQDQAQKASTAMGKSFTKFSGFVEQHSAQIKKAGKYLTVFGGIATAAFAVSVKSAANFETQLANVSTMLDESAMKILPEYRKGLQSLSVDFGESTETLSKGLYDILSASIPPAEALGVLEVSAKAAAAGITDTGVAADAITTILNSYGMSADQAGVVSDKLFAIVKEGKTNFAELAPSIGKVAATASMAGLSFDDLGACIATMTRAGIRTEETMTAINGVLIAFLKPTDEAKEAAAKFGLTLDTNTLKTEGLTGVMEKLKNATAEQLAAIFPNIRGLKGMAAALGDAEGYAKSYALMLDSAGLTQEAFEKQSATLNFKLGQLKEMFNVIKVTIGTALIPAVENIVKKTMGVLKKVKEWTEANKPLTETIVKWAAAISGVMLVLGPLLMMLPGAIAGVHLLAGSFTAFVATGALIAVVAGVIKLANYLRETVGGMREFREELGKMKLEEVETQIEELTSTLDQLQKRFSEIPEGIGRQEILTMIDEINKRLEMLYKRREELIYLTETGIDLTYEEIKAREEIEARIKEEEEAVKALIEGQKGGIAATGELLSFMESIRIAIEKITAAFTPYEQKVAEINTKYDEMIEKIKTYNVTEEEQADAIKEVNIVRSDALKKLGEEKTAMDELNQAKKVFSDIMKTVTDKIYEFTHTDYEVKLKAINDKYDELITKAKELYTNEDELAKIIETLNIARTGEIAGLDELTAKEGENVRSKNKLIDSYKTLRDRMYELTHTQLENAIHKLDQQKQTYLDLGMAIDLVNKWYAEEIKNLDELNKMKGKGIEKNKELAESYEPFGPKRCPMYLFGKEWVTAWPEKEGGPIKAFMEVAKFLVRGGSTDTVPIMATPGEYVIKKQMVDFIKRTGMVTGGLIGAIKKGLPTPSPQFAGGGMVGSWGISRGPAGVVSGRSGSWVYSPTIHINNPVVRSDEDLVNIKELMREVLEESADELDLSGNEIGV